jgi:hypothetical protein
VVNPPEAPEPPKKSKSTGVTLEINLENGQHELRKAAEIIFPYRDDDDDGFEDSTRLDVRKLCVFYYNDKKKEWEKKKSELDTKRKYVRVTTDHFSLYALFAETSGAPESGSAEEAFALGEVYAFPNPAKPDQTPKIHVEAGLADAVRIDIYDMAGDLVHSAEVAGGAASVINGKYAYEYPWEQKPASGVYIYIIKARKHGFPELRKTGKMAVVR